jgi:MFS family permease
MSTCDRCAMTAANKATPGTTTDITGKLFSPTFVLLCVSTIFYYVAFGASAPLLPRYAKHLGYSKLATGLIVSSFAISAVILRPSLGRLGDQRGRRLLVIGGATLTGISFTGNVFAESVRALVFFRLFSGAGQAAVIIGAAALAVDMAPAHRKGEAASFILVAFQLGIGVGPILSEQIVKRWSYGAAWSACAASCFACAVLASRLPKRRVQGHQGPVVRRVLHPVAIRPGVIMGLGVFGFSGFATYVSVFGPSIGVETVGPIFLMLAAMTVLVRVVGFRLPDQLGPAVGGSIALALVGTGMIAIGVLREPWVLYTLTLWLGCGGGLMFPCLAVAAVQPVPEHERSAALATFTMFIDIAVGISGFALGWVAGLTSYAGAFITGGSIALVGSAAAMFYFRPIWNRQQRRLALGTVATPPS